MSSSEDESGINWENIETIKSFDGSKLKSSIFFFREVSTSFPLSAETKNTNLNGNSTKLQEGSIIEMVAGKATTPTSLLVESLIQQFCTMIEPDPELSSNLYTAICKQLYQMNLIDETYSMGEFELMRNQYRRALYQLVCVAKGQDLPVDLKSFWPLRQLVGMDWSRYHREFDEISYIAGGGFGKVYKARHKLDGIEYAVKKVIIKQTTINRVLVHLSEVKTLASLNHTNIVPYKAAWLEPFLESDNSENAIEDDESGSESFSSEPIKTDSLRRKDDTSDFIEFQRSEGFQSESSISEKKIVKFNRSLSYEGNQPELKLRWATLYIQMSLCQLTLREWLDLRNKNKNFDEFYSEFIQNDPIIDDGPIEHLNVVNNIFNQLINGLIYIHSRKIVHHDLKPSNIFIDHRFGKIVVRLGDFGLACPLENSHNGEGFGTPLYAAPEQYQGECNPKSDVYSLGIILLELLLPFGTDMERLDVIKKVKAGQISKEIDSKYSSILKRLLKSHESRPDALQLLEIMNNLNSTDGSLITKLERRLSKQDSEIDDKNEELKIKDKEIIELKLQVQLRDEEILRLQMLISQNKLK